MKTLVIEVLNCILLLSLANFAGASDAATQRQVATRTEPPKAAEQRAPEQPAKPLSSLKKTLPAIQYSLPLSFEPNRGQAPPDVELISHFGATALLLEKSAMTLHLCGKDDEISRSDIERIERGQHHGCNPLRNAVIHTSFVRASDSTQIEALDLLQGISNYFIGSDPKQWHTNIPVYARVRYRNIYPGIDLLFHGTEGQLEYDFVIAAGADPKPITLAVSGATKIAIDRNGDLLLQSAAGDLRWRKPKLFQEIAGVIHDLDGHYEVSGNQIRFQIAEYNHGYPLTIDPVLTYATYFPLLERPHAGVALDSQGNVLVAGLSSDASYNQYATVLKIAPSQSGNATLVYTTSLGSGVASGVAVDAAGNAYVTGDAGFEFPVVNGFPGPAAGGAFVAKLDANGTVVYSSVFGSASGRGIAVDNARNAYITGNAFGDFPVTSGSFQGACPPLTRGCAFVAKVDPSKAGAESLVYSTFLADSNSERTGKAEGHAIAVDKSTGEAYVTGFTNGFNFPITPNAYQWVQAGHLGTPDDFVIVAGVDGKPIWCEADDAFVTKLNSIGTGLVYSTYLGGCGFDSGEGIAVGESGRAWVTGFTNSYSPGPYLDDAFIVRLSANGNSLEFFNHFGGTQSDRGWSVSLDCAENAYVGGSTVFGNGYGAVSNDFPGIDIGTGSVTDGFLARFGSAPFSSLIGGEVRRVAADCKGGVFLTGDTRSPDLPVSTNALPINLSASETGYLVSLTLPTDHAGLSVKGAATPSPALLGGTVKFTLFVSNGGPGTATGVTLSDTQPAGVTIVSASASQGSCSTAAVIVCSLGTLLEGGTASVAVTVTPSALGTITNVATVSGNEPDPDPSDSTVSTSVAVVLGADLSVRKVADADPAAVGTKLTYTVTVTNSGPGEASSVLLQDILPQAYVSFDSADSTQGDCSSGVNDSLVACNLGTIAPGAAAVVHIKVLVNYPGDLLNLVRVVANEPDSNWSNNLTSLRTKAEYICDLSVTKTAVPAKVEPGAAFGYHIVVKNNGPSPAGTVRISDTVPDGMAFDAPPGCSLSNRTITCLRFNVVVGGEATVDFSASAQSGPIVNTAKVALASGIDPNLLNNTSSVTEQIGSNSGNPGGNPGSTCGCSKTGAYLDPAKGVDPEVTPTGNSTGTSPHGKYNLEVTTAGGLTSLYITQGTKSVFTSGSFSAADQKWGFSPDDDRFVFSYFEGQSKEVTLLVDLTNKYKPKEIDTLFGPPLVQFSPSGKYLTYVTLQGQRTAGISIIDAETGIHAYDSGNLLFVTNVPPGNLSNEERDENDFGMVDWGFSPDDGDRWFVFAIQHQTGDVDWNLIDLQQRKLLINEPLLIISAFWQFSPCGDVIARAQQLTASEDRVTVDAIFTANKGSKGVGNFPIADAVSFRFDGTQHIATIGAGDYPFAQAKDVPCPSKVVASNTGVGNSVLVEPVDGRTGETPASVTFASVTAEGSTSVSTGVVGPGMPAGFQAATPMLYYDLSTTAIFAGATTVCINYAGTQFPADSTDDPLSLFHFENGTWVDVTTSRNVAMNTICGQTTSLSPFAVFQRSLDIVPPVTTASLLPQPNSVGWNTQAVTVTLSAADNPGGSGVKQITYATGDVTIASGVVPGALATVSIAAEGRTTISYFATDSAGNVEAPKQLVVSIDRQAPTINCARNDGLWHATDVGIQCTGADGGSGLANASDASFSLNTMVSAGTETANASTGVRAVCDIAENCATAGRINGVMVDKKAPTITIGTPNGGTYLLNQAMAANYTCTDAGSGVAMCSGLVSSGSNVDTASAGTKSFAVNASDNVGNAAAPRISTYTVVYNVCLLYDPSKSVHSGSTIPLKIQICDANGKDASSSSVVVHAASLLQASTNASELIQDSGNANPDDNFRFDPTLGPTGGYIFNLSTKGLPTGSYVLNFTVSNDPQAHSIGFQVR